MPVPTYDQFIEPILRHLAAHPEGALARDLHEAAADTLELSKEDRQVILPSGAQAVYRNRCGWAHDRLKRAGYSASPRRGLWQLTPAGRTFADTHPAPLPAETVEEIATGHMEVRLRPAKERAEETSATELLAAESAAASPDDRLEAAIAEMRRAVAAELLEVLGQVPPAAFEAIVLDLLHRMGYGTSRADLQRVGGPGDGGIDGVISLDRLGLEKVYVQAKRWQSPVGRPEVQGFCGALAGQRAGKGVFITTSTFTPQAIEFAKSVEGIVLVDGRRLADLMIDHEVGVTLRPVKVPKLDGDYFE
jgi:restriction system protein